METLRSVIDRRFITMLIFTLAILILLRPEGIFWLEDDQAVKDYLKENIDTNYKYIKLSEVQFAIKAPNIETSHRPNPYDSLFIRYFSIFQYDPDEVSKEKNFRIDGYVNQRGKIVIYDHVYGNPIYV